MFRKSTKKQPELAEAGVRLQAQMDRIEQLEKEITGLRRNKLEISPALQARNNARWLARQAEQKLEDQSRRYLGPGDGMTNAERPALQREIQEAQDEYRRAEAALAQMEAEKAAQQAARKTAEAELADLKKGCGIDHALAFQQELAEAEKRVPEVKALVDEQERVIREAKATIPSAEQILERREDILAGLSTGDATEAQLKAVDQELETLNSHIADASAKSSEIIATAEARLAGLRRMLKDAEQQLEKLTLQKPEVARLFLKTQAALVYSDYLNLGEQLGEKFVKLMSLNALICSVPERRHIDHSILLMASVMKIPRFKIGPDAEAPSMSTVFAAAEQRIDLAREAEKSRLKGEGFSLLD